MTERLHERHEREIATWLPAGSQTLASGAVAEKRDVQQDRTETNKYWRFLTECRETQSKGYRVTAQEWKALERDVLNRSSDMRPALALRFCGVSKGRGTAVEADLVVLDVRDFVELLHEFDALRGAATK